jgi:hypothetical protein
MRAQKLLAVNFNATLVMLAVSLVPKESPELADGRSHICDATQKFPKFECRAKTACSTVVGL